MADINNISEFYKFLSSFGTQDGKAGWIEVADCKKEDGIITKAEFRQFLNENWNGEASLSDDLINDYWSKIDTNKSSKITGSKLSNKNALDKNEQSTMLRSIKVYEAVENTLSSLSTDASVGDTSKWKNSIREGLINKLEKEFIKTTKPIEDVEDYIEEILPGIQRKATADYCAQTYISETMSEAVEKYEYKYGDDSTLKKMIDNYVKEVENDENIDETDIEDAVKEIIDAYKETAKADGNPDLDLLKKYGYEGTGEKSPLNDLQQAVVKGTIKEALKSVESEEGYSDNKELYDNAVNKFIEAKLSGAKFEDFSELLKVDYSGFTASTEFKNAKNTITVQKFMTSEDLSKAITTQFGEKVANTVIKDGAYITAVKNIKAATLEKVQNGEFLTNDKIDMTKVQEFVLSELKKHLADLYKGDLNKMSLDELSSMYDNLHEAAMENSDADTQLKGIRDAAKKYCDALSKKSTALAEGVKEILGDEKIEDMLPSEIDEKIAEIKAKAAEIGDATEFKGKLPNEAWGNLPNSVAVDAGGQVGFKMADTITINGKTVSADRITYKSNNEMITISENGSVIVKGTASGKVKVSILIDGVEVGTKDVAVTVRQSAATIVSKAINYNIAGDQWGWNKDSTFQDLYNSDGIFTIYAAMDNSWSNWNYIYPAAIANLLGLGGGVITALASTGMDINILTKALSIVADRYVKQGPMTNDNDHGTSQGDLMTHQYEFMNGSRGATKSRIVTTRDDDGADSCMHSIHFKDFVDDIVAEYYNLGGIL